MRANKIGTVIACFAFLFFIACGMENRTPLENPVANESDLVAIAGPGGGVKVGLESGCDDPKEVNQIPTTTSTLIVWLNIPASKFSDNYCYTIYDNGVCEAGCVGFGNYRDFGLQCSAPGGGTNYYINTVPIFAPVDPGTYTLVLRNCGTGKLIGRDSFLLIDVGN